MHRIIIFFIKSLILILLFLGNLYAEELTIIPLKKPILDKITKERKITQGIIRPKPKPIKKIKKILAQENIKPIPKPSKEIKKKIEKVIEKKEKKIEKITTTELKKDEKKKFF